MNWALNNWSDLCSLAGIFLTVAGAAVAVRSLLGVTEADALKRWNELGAMGSRDDKINRTLPSVRGGSMKRHTRA